MNIKKPRIEGSPFWLDTLTQRRYETARDVPSDIPKERLQHWDSALEYSFYRKLLRIFPKEAIHPHFPIMLLPKNEIFPQLDWSIDFVVSSWFIECKGDYIASSENGIVRANFIKTLRLFQDKYPPLFSNFLLIGSEAKQLGRTKLRIITADEAIEKIQRGK